MGNNLTYFYSPPSPPTPLSRDKYFWIPSNATAARNDGDGRSKPSLETSEDRAEAARMIPVVHITRKGIKTAKGKDNESSAGSGGSGKSNGGKDDKSLARRYTLLYCHGHDVDVGLIYDFMLHLSKFLGVDVMTFDYVGYGLSKIGVDGDEIARDAEGNTQSDSMTFYSDMSRRSSASSWGGSGAPTEQQCYDDVLACYNYLVGEKQVPPQNIILYGKSLGSGPACWLANRLCREVDERAEMDCPGRTPPEGGRRAPTPIPRGMRRPLTPPPGKALTSRGSKGHALLDPQMAPLGGLVLHSAFLSILRLKIHVGFALSSGDAFCNLEMLQEMHGGPSPEQPPKNGGGATFPLRSVGHELPIYLIHGTEDSVVPFVHGRALHELIVERRAKGFLPFWADGATHWNVEHRYATAYIKRLQQFVRYCDKVNYGDIDIRRYHRRRARKVSSNRGHSGGAANPVADGPASVVESTEVAPFVSVDAGHSISRADIQQRLRQRSPEAPNSARGSARGRAAGRSDDDRRRTARSKSRARQRKKKGTLVMRGTHEEEDDAEVERNDLMKVYADSSAGEAKLRRPQPVRASTSLWPKGQDSGHWGKKQFVTSTLRTTARESRNPPSQQARS